MKFLGKEQSYLTPVYEMTSGYNSRGSTSLYAAVLDGDLEIRFKGHKG